MLSHTVKCIDSLYIFPPDDDNVYPIHNQFYTLHAFHYTIKLVLLFYEDHNIGLLFS